MPDGESEIRVTCAIDGSNFFASLRVRQFPTQLHHTRLRVRIADMPALVRGPGVEGRTTRG